MKKTRLIVGICSLVTSLSAAIVVSGSVVDTFSMQKVTKEIDTNWELFNGNPAFTESVFNTNTDDLLPIVFRRIVNSDSVVIEKNNSVKTTKKETNKENKKETKKQNKKTKSKNTKNKKSKKSKKSYKSLGTFKITGYCSCASCCGKSNGITASGTKATAGRTIAADTSRFAFGSKLVIDGHTYTVEDRGGAINGNKIDMYFDTHSEALQWGVRYCTVYVEE